MLRETKEGVLLDIEVQPNAKKNEIVKVDEWRNRLVIKIKAPPKNGKANKEIIKFFFEIFKKKCKIVKGEKSSQKTILILDANIDDIKKKIIKQ